MGTVESWAAKSRQTETAGMKLKDACSLEEKLHGCSSKAQPLLLTLDEGSLLTATLPDLQRGIAPLGPPAPMLPRLLGHGVGLPGHCPWPQARGMGYLLPAAVPDLRRGVTPLVAAPASDAG